MYDSDSHISERWRESGSWLISTTVSAGWVPPTRLPSTKQDSQLFVWRDPANVGALDGQ